ncbi:MAG: tRNA lysidine(34) synthetase TilS [Clostridia bacterium]|nr:tRNA lysidine(34) synthetase TilS [Clostridia bacterium]
MDISFIDKNDMLPAGCRVLCAVSGGVDSTYLLCRILELSRQRGFSVCAAHFNHCLRGAESDRDEAFIGKFCEDRGVEFVSGRGDVGAFAAERGMSTEEAARQLRYDFLEKAADELGADRIATAHNADDNAETMLMNLARGAGLRGLCGIPPVRGRLIRPMLTVRRAEAEAYLNAYGVDHVEDRTNADDDYARNRVRHHAVPVLLSVNPGFVENASRTAALMREDEEFLESLAGKFLEEAMTFEGLPAKQLAALPRPVASRAVRLLTGAGEEKHVDAVMRLALGEGLGYADLPGLRVVREQGKLQIGGKEPAPIERRELRPGEELFIKDAGLVIRSRIIPDCSEVHSSLNTFFFNYENICGIIFCTSRSAGDKIRLNGRNCTKKLSDLFTERKLSHSQRILTPVLRDDKGVLAVYGFGIAERCAAKPGDTVLRVDLLKEWEKAHND